MSIQSGYRGVTGMRFGARSLCCVLIAAGSVLIVATGAKAGPCKSGSYFDDISKKCLVDLQSGNLGGGPPPSTIGSFCFADPTLHTNGSWHGYCTRPSGRTGCRGWQLKCKAG